MSSASKVRFFWGAAHVCSVSCMCVAVSFPLFDGLLLFLCLMGFPLFLCLMGFLLSLCFLGLSATNGRRTACRVK